MNSVEQMEKALADLRRLAAELYAMAPDVPGVFGSGSYE